MSDILGVQFNAASLSCLWLDGYAWWWMGVPGVGGPLDGVVVMSTAFHDSWVAAVAAYVACSGSGEVAGELDPGGSSAFRGKKPPGR